MAVLMPPILSFAWRQLGRIQLTLVLCLLLTADLTWGHICLDRNTIIFAPLNDVGLFTWAHTYGRHNLAHTAWFFILLGLLVLFCLNTFVCTTDRVAVLLRSRRHGLRLIFKLAPHVMHYALLIMLSGYLSSYLLAQVLEPRTLLPGNSITLPGTSATISLASFEPKHYEGRRLPPAFQNRVLQPITRLRLSDGKRSQTVFLDLNRPVKFKGFRIFLKDFAPKTKHSMMGRQTRVDLQIRKDPGVIFYLAGMFVFTLGLILYLVELVFFKKTKKDIP